ncbi:alpha/beta hydrolase [Nocardia yunnanensis]|uniref:Alpha/beta hydrolase n=1 Tax=Nocardia yunnanensis TaxID=2382165 RepID=A0A386ZIT1_9NOCA|nr:alpha/beta hydrolase [Nocardia yunnanensis]AYF77143.1 alpha/beta hydrolase [Nocardia yunnanensis]
MPFVTTDDGAKVHYRDTGGDGPAVLMLHGFFMDSVMWEPQEKSLAPAYRLVSVDARGHGGTTDDGEPFDHWTLARDAFAVADQLGIERFAIIGQFQGGWIGMRMALQQRSRVRGLAAIGSRSDAYDPSEYAAYKRIILGQWILGDGDLEAIAKPIAAMMVGGTREHHRFWLDRWLADDRRRLEQAGWALMNRESIDDMLADITVPVLVMHGVGDPVYHRDHQEALAARFGGPTRVETINAVNANHSPTFTHPELTDPILRDWLDGLPA